MKAMNGNHQGEIVRLTRTAVEAARSGRWDIVIQCYRDRGVLLETATEVIDQGEDLLVLDRQVRDHAQTAQVLLASLLDEAASTRRRLQGVRRRLRVPASVSEAISVEV